MVKQYPHTANLVYAGASTTADNGDIIPGATTQHSFPCRLEPASNSGYAKAIDGVRVDFAWVVYCSKTTAVIPEGAAITIVDKDSATLCSDTVKQFSRGQFNCRLWL